MKQRTRLSLMLVMATASACGGQGDPICAPEALREALGEAQPGDVVRIGACRVAGDFTVPPGVTLTGSGPDASSIAGGPSAALTLAAGAAETCVQHLTIDTNGLVGILARETERVCLQNVRVQAHAGIGVGLEDVAVLTMVDVEVRGMVDASNAQTIPATATATEASTHGLVLIRVPDGALTDVSVTGFATAGAVLIDSGTRWVGGGARLNRSLGLLVEGGNADLTDLELSSTLSAFTLYPPYGGAFTATAAITSQNLTVDRNAGVGLFHASATAVHSGLEVNNNRITGLWAQNVPALDVSGNFANNRLAGIMVLGSRSVTVHDSEISNTIETTRLRMSPESIGDGIQLVETVQDVRVRDVRLTENERVGVVLDLGRETLDPVTLDGVQVSGSGDQLGAIAQNGTIPDGWDDGVQRNGDVLANDRAFAGILGVSDGVGPCDRPRSGMLGDGGLAAIVGL